MLQPLQLFLQRLCLAILLLCYAFNAGAQQGAYEIKENISYYSEAIQKTDSYLKNRCKLDVYYPTKITNAPTVIWFHGGGLSSGEKHIPEGLLEKGVIVVSVNYRLHPQVQNPIYIEDAAAAVAWTFNNIAAYNGNMGSIFISGHSAGGYLASMVVMDKKWLQKHRINADDIAGLIPFSGHTITHFTIRKEQGIKGTQPTIDAFAPLYHVRQNSPPTLLITGDRELELLGRYEENAYFYRMMKVVGHPKIQLLELDGYGHNMVAPAVPLLLKFVQETENR